MAKLKVVTIDGPAGAGKSTVAKRLAERIGWRLLDTGAMYRAITLAALRKGIDLRSDVAMGSLAADLDFRLQTGRVQLDGEDVTLAIRDQEVTRCTKHAADCPSVRRLLVEWQRQFAEAEGPIVTEGRDQGTIVFPSAYRKFYLVATDLERSKRRHAELAERGLNIALTQVLHEILERDAHDANRSIAPMRPALDAKVIDSSGLTLDEVVSLLEEEICRGDR